MALSLGCASAQTLADRFFDEYYFPYNPTAATSAGIHKYDDKLEDYSEERRRRPHRRAAKVRSRIRLGFLADADRDLVLNNIRAALLDIETIRSWEKNPDLYSRRQFPGSAFTIISRTFAPA